MESLPDPAFLCPEVLMSLYLCPCLLSPSTGLCVATPTRVRVFQEFHLHLRLPTSVRRFEQLELRPVLYNYLDNDVTVRPMGVCALRAGGKGGCYQGQDRQRTWLH